MFRLDLKRSGPRYRPAREGATIRAVTAGLARVSLLTLALLFTPSNARAADATVVRGDAVVTAFSGTKAAEGDLPPGGTEIDRVFIDLEGIVAKVHDLSTMGAGPNGQLVTVPIRWQGKARDLGQVFGIALDGNGADGPPNIYLSASSAYGLQIVLPQPGGPPARLDTGYAGAQWMDGQWGKGGGPGSIYKVDGRTGEVTLFATVTANGQPMKGAALGNITFDPRSRQLFVSNLETGFIHRLSLDGKELGTFDHGTTGRSAAGLPAVGIELASNADITSEAFRVDDPATWGFTDKRRLVYGIAVSDGRLYYATGDGPEIWSMQLGIDGRFGSDPHREFAVTGTPANNVITHITFDGPDTIYLAQRGAQTGSYDYSVFAKPQTSVVYRYKRTGGTWAAAREEYAIGVPTDHRATVGGIALNYGYDANGQMDYGQCRKTLWTTGEHLRAGAVAAGFPAGPEEVQGLQGTSKDLVRPANVPPKSTWFIDFDASFDDPVVDGHTGDVATLQECGPGKQAAAPPQSAAPSVAITKSCQLVAIGGRVPCTIVVTNTGTSLISGEITFGEEMTILAGPDAGAAYPVSNAEVDGDEWSCSEVPSDEFQCTLSGKYLPPGTSRSVLVWVDTSDYVLAGNIGFHNCARLAGDFSGESCIDGGEPGLTVTKTAPSHCDAGGLCTFDITVTNDSGDELEGEVALTDNMTGAPGPTLITAIDPPLPCLNQPTSAPFSCSGTVELDAGESKTYQITIQLPPGKYDVNNCIAISDSLLIPDPNDPYDWIKPNPNGEDGDPSDNPNGYVSCVQVDVGPPVIIIGCEGDSCGMGFVPPAPPSGCDDGSGTPCCPKGWHKGYDGQCHGLYVPTCKNPPSQDWYEDHCPSGNPPLSCDNPPSKDWYVAYCTGNHQPPSCDNPPSRVWFNAYCTYQPPSCKHPPSRDWYEDHCTNKKPPSCDNPPTRTWYVANCTGKKPPSCENPPSRDWYKDHCTDKKPPSCDNPPSRTWYVANCRKGGGNAQQTCSKWTDRKWYDANCNTQGRKTTTHDCRRGTAWDGSRCKPIASDGKSSKPSIKGGDSKKLSNKGDHKPDRKRDHEVKKFVPKESSKPHRETEHAKHKVTVTKHTDTKKSDKKVEKKKKTTN